jgi:hypothetical protein
VRFAERGEPQAILRVVNPREAGLIDGASGILVRFRLAGASFPPQVVYKLFTQRPLCDIGTFAPRDYTVAKAKPAKFYNLHGPAPPTDERVGWYERYENNEWRPVVQRFAQTFEEVQFSASIQDMEQTGGSFASLFVKPKPVGTTPGTNAFHHMVSF